MARAAGGEPQVVVLAGEGGVGKSALLRRFQQTRRRPALVVECDVDEARIPFAALHHVMRLPASADPFVVGRELLQLLAPRDDSGPACLVVDDAHLMDPESARAVTFALRRLRRDPVLAVLAVRSDELTELPAGLVRLADGRGTRLDLEGLTSTEVTQLALELRGIRLTAQQAERLRRHTGGSPLHLRALLREMTEHQLRSDDIPLPAPRSFARLVARALDGTSSSAQRIARAAAVLGSRTTLAALSSVSAVEDPLTGLEELHRAGIVRTVGVGPTVHLVFEHELVRVAVEESTGPASWRRLHQRAAAVVPPPGDLDHLVAAATGADESLAHRLVERACQASADGNPRLAARDLLLARELSADEEAAQGRLLHALYLLAQTGDIPSVLQRRAELDAIDSGYAQRIRARVAMLTGDLPLARRLGLAAWDVVDGESAQVDVAGMLAQLCILGDDGRGAYEWAARALPTSHALGPEGSALRALGALGLAISGSPATALALLGDLPDDPAAVPPEQHDELRIRGTIRLLVDDLEHALADARVAATTEHDISPLRLGAIGAVAETRYRLGDWDGALATAEHGVSLVQDSEQEWLRPFLDAYASMVLAGRGDFAAAEKHVRNAAEVGDRLSDVAGRAYAANAAVHLAMCRADPAAVLAECSYLLGLGPASAAWQPGILAWPPHWAEALVDLGRLDDAQEALEAVDAVDCDTTVTSRELALARVWGRLEARRGRLTAARDWFTRAATGRDDWPDALESARAQADLGSFLRHRGERRAAVEHLSRARGMFVRLGAEPFLAAYAAELDAVGIARAEASAGWSPLTPQEQAVARLVARGMTNQQVADELMLSAKTINFHLEHVYHKLGVHSRSQLAARYHAGSFTPAEPAVLQGGEAS